MRIGYLFGGRYDALALGGNAVDIREDVDGMEALGHELVFRSFETARLEIPATLRTAKSRLPASLWDTTRDAGLLRKTRDWRRRLAGDNELAEVELLFEYWYPDSFAGGLLAGQRHVPHVLENLDPLTDERRRASRSLLAHRLESAERRRRQSASALIVMSRMMGDYLVSEWDVDPARVHWLPQGVNTDLFAPVAPEERDRTRRELATEPHLVGFVGSLASYQRVEILVEAMRILRGRRNDVKLVLVGGTPERAAALKAGDFATVIPHIPYELVPRLVAALDVAVLPDSNWYGSPVKVLEYGATGVPVVAPDIGPVRDLLSAPEEGVLVPPNEPEALAVAIERVLDDPTAAAARAKRFEEKVRTHFSRRDRTRQLLELCASLVSGRDA